MKKSVKFIIKRLPATTNTIQNADQTTLSLKMEGENHNKNHAKKNVFTCDFTFLIVQ